MQYFNYVIHSKQLFNCIINLKYIKIGIIDSKYYVPSASFNISLSILENDKV